MKKLFKKSESVSFKNKKEKKQLLNIALEYGFKWMSGKEVFDFEPPTDSNVLAFFRKSKKIGWAVANDIEKNTPANKFIKRFEKTDLEKRVDEMQNSLNHALSIIDSKDRARQERLRELEQISNNIIKGYELVKNKKNDTLVLGGNMLDNINFKELSFEEAHKQAYESICKHYGITDTEVKGVTFNQQPKEESLEIRYPKGWYKSTKEGNLALLYFDGKDFLYGFNYKGEWEDEAHVCQDRKYEVIEEGTVILERESVIEQRLIKEAIKRGFNIDCEINCKNGQNFPAIVNEFEYVQEEKKLLYSGIEIMKNGIWENCKPYDKLSFKPVFMKCTQEQFDRMRPKLESVGCEFTDSLTYINGYVLTNDNQNRLISFVNESSKLNEKRKEVHTEAKFLEACGYVEEKIEYTLENIQVDCRGLSEEQIREMADVFKNKGCIIGSLNIKGNFYLLRYGECNYAFVFNYDETKTTITYEKFMELFSEKPIEEEQKTVRISELPVRNIEELHAEHNEAKREPKVGDVVKAWDNKGNFIYGIYEEHKKDECAYIVSNIWFDNIELVTEININDFKREEN